MESIFLEPRIKGCVVRSRMGMPTAATSHTHKKVSWKLAPNRTSGFTMRRAIADPQPPQEPERHKGENAHIHPRNHQHVIAAGALEIRASGPVDEGVLANH